MYKTIEYYEKPDGGMFLKLDLKGLERMLEENSEEIYKFAALSRITKMFSLQTKQLHDLTNYISIIQTDF